MHLKKLALIVSLTLALGVPGWAAQKGTSATGNHPAATESKTKQPTVRCTVRWYDRIDRWGQADVEPEGQW